jgi:hypothetical protein
VAAAVRFLYSNNMQTSKEGQQIVVYRPRSSQCRGCRCQVPAQKKHANESRRAKNCCIQTKVTANVVAAAVRRLHHLIRHVDKAATAAVTPKSF